MASRKLGALLVLVGLALIAARPANAQSFQVQCPTSTITHPTAANSEPAYTGATTFATGAGGYLTPASHVNGAIKCQQISGGDGFATMGDGTQTYLFAFGPLSGLQDMANGLPGTEFPSVFNVPYGGTFKPGDPATADGASSISYYYLAPDAGTYFWHCHITPPEHLQMGMVGQIY